MQDDDWDIYGQRVDGDGTLLGSTLVLCAEEGDQTVPAVAYHAATGHYLVTWQDAREGDAADVYARAVEGGSGTLGGLADLSPLPPSRRGKGELAAPTPGCGCGWDSAYGGESSA